MMSGRPIAEDDLHAYVDGALDKSRRDEVEAYLGQQPEVRARVEGYVAQREALRNALGTIAQEPVPPELSLSRLIETSWRPRGLPWISAAAAAVALFTVGGVSGWSLHTMNEGRRSGVAALAQEAADTYAVFGPDRKRPVEIRAADQAELVAWVSNRIKHPVSIPDLTGSGYRFVGGRLVATAHGPAGMFMYDDDQGTRLAMLVRPMAVDQSAPMSEHENGSTAGITWASNGIGYSLVGPAAPAVLHPLANEARRQIDNSI